MIYRIDNLACTDCAARIEAEARKLTGVKTAHVHFASGRIELDLDDTANETEIFHSLARHVRRIEPEAVLRPMLDHGHDHDHDHSGRWTLIGLGVSAILFAAGWTLMAKDTPQMVIIGVFLAVYLISGYRVLLAAIRDIFSRDIFNENLLMTVATAGAWVLGEYAEAAAVMLFFHVGEYFQSLAVARSRRSIAGLMDIRPEFANLLKDGVATPVDPAAVEIGDLIAVRPGERVPLDGVVRSGASRLDTAALTGESLPRAVGSGDPVLSGSINLSGLLELEVTSLSADSTVSRILAEVEHATSRKSKSEHFITRFAKAYTPVVFGLSLLLALIPPLAFGGEWNDWIYRALVFLVISCPCALVISVPLAFFAGIGGASRRGILFKGGNYMETLARVSTIAFDKTGTLTEGLFAVREVRPAPGFDRETILESAAYAEANSTHPIAVSLRAAWGGKLDPARIGNVEEVAGQGVRATVDGKEIAVGNAKLMESCGAAVPDQPISGTVVHVAARGAYAGSIAIADALKSDAAHAVEQLRAEGVRRMVLLTGDNRPAAAAVAAELKLDEVHAELLPTGKVECLERLMHDREPGETLCFVGDGINDAPVLARADVGVAMGALGSDAAVESADVVLMTGEPSRLPEAIRFARHTLGIVRGNIGIALGVKLIVLLAGAAGLVTMWAAVFADVGVCLLAVLNALRALKLPEKNAR